MQKLSIFLIVLCSFFNSEAQNPLFISGILKDTLNFSSTSYSSVSLIQTSDSLLQSFTRANEDGEFQLKVPKPGKYFVLISHPNFIQFIDVVEVTNQDINLGMLPMLSKQQLLTEVVITDQQKIVIKGDTVEFNADSFQTRQYDNVDELLKKLPGLEMSKDGTIRAYGEKVQKMLVDGEEFFSDDPAVVAKTLRASTVDKVQVYDKKSDQAELTGIDDGEKVKTINLKLKDEAKRGYFGKLSAGGGLPFYWDNQAMFNLFNKKRKFSLYGTMANTNTTGLDWSDQNRFGSMGGDGGMRVNYGGGGGLIGDFNNGSFSGQGIPKTWSAGTSYSNNWLDGKLKSNGNYQYNQSNIEARNQSRTQFILPDTQYISQNTGEQRTQSINQAAGATINYEIDTTSSVKLYVNGRHSKQNQHTQLSVLSNALDGSIINQNQQLQSTEGINQSLNANLLYWKKFKKKGRSFSANFSGNYSDRDQKGFLDAEYNLFAIDSVYFLHQRKEDKSYSVEWKSRFVYTEPLSKIAFLELNYSLESRQNHALNYSFDREMGMETDILNPLNSSEYQFNSLMNQGGGSVRLNWEKIKISFGGNVSNTDFHQIDQMRDTTLRYANLNFFPKVNISFEKTRQNRFSFGYNGQTRQPTIEQLSPLRNNSDPLNVAIGNPELTQEFSHNFNLSLFNYKVLTAQFMMAFLNFSYIQNAISLKQNIDISGRRTYQYVNVAGNINGSFYARYSFKKIWDIAPSIGVNGNLIRTHDFINGERNLTTILGLTPNAGLQYFKDTTYSLSYSISPSLNQNRSSIRPDVKTDYWNVNQKFDGSVLLPFSLKLGSEIEWNIRQKLDPLENNNNVFFWNAFLKKSFLKNKSLEAELFIHDLLNQNVGYNRYNTPNQISESSYNTIKRYFMLRIIWNFTKTGAKVPQANQIIIHED